MKRIYTIILLTAVSVATFSQQSNPSQALTRQDYLLKSKHQKTAAWVLLGGGAALTITGALIPRKETFDPWSFQKTTVGGEAFYLLGGLSALASIPFFIASARNKRKAMAISASGKIEDASILHAFGVLQIHYPALSVRINL